MRSSEQINELAKALSQAQAAMKPAIKDSMNPHFKSSYADLASVWDACREPLTKNGLAVIQTTRPMPDGVCIVTTLTHSSGQWYQGELEMYPSQRTPQAFGAAITYGRRFALMAIVGIAPEDDDGNEASGPSTPPVQRPQPTGLTQTRQNAPQARPSAPPQGNPGKGSKIVTEAQVKRLYAIQSKSSWTPEDVKAYMFNAFKKESSKDLTMAEYDVLCGKLEGEEFNDAWDALVGRAKPMEAPEPGSDLDDPYLDSFDKEMAR